MKKVKFSIVLVLVCVLMLSLIGCSKDSGNKKDEKQTVSEKDDEKNKNDKDEKKEDKPTAATTEEPAEPPFEEYYLVDYAVFMKYLAEDTSTGNHNRNLDLVAGCQVFDSDGDGYKELYTQILSNDFNGNCYVISPSTKPGIFISSQSGPAGECDIQYSSVENQIYYCTGYSTVGFSFANYYKYNGNNGVFLEMGYTQTLESSEGIGVYKEEANWKGDVQMRTRNEDEASLVTEWNEKLKALELTAIDNNYNSITNIVSTDSIEQSVIAMEKHLNSLGVKYLTTSIDLDGNGTKEQVYAIENYCEKWMNNTNAEYCFDNQMFYDVYPNGLVYIILDGNDEETNIYVDIKKELYDVSELTDKDGLCVISSYETEVIYNLYTPGEDSVIGIKNITQDEAHAGVGDSIYTNLTMGKYYAATLSVGAIYEYIFYEDFTYQENTYVEGIDGPVLGYTEFGRYSIDGNTSKVYFYYENGGMMDLYYNLDYNCLMVETVDALDDSGSDSSSLYLRIMDGTIPSVTALFEYQNEIIQSMR